MILTGSLCLTDISEAYKKKHSAFTKAANGKIYMDFTQFINDKPDQYKNDSSLLLNSKKEKKESEGKVYIGNAKKLTKREDDQAASAPVIEKHNEDLPF
jgi:hypothetical protein